MAETFTQDGVEVTTGNRHVRPIPGTSKLSRDRELNAVTTVQRTTWTAAEKVSEVTITVFPGAGTARLGDGVCVVFDAPNTTVEALWLAEGSAMRKVVLVGVPRTFTFYQSNGEPHYLTGLAATDLADSGATDMNILIEAN